MFPLKIELMVALKIQQWQYFWADGIVLQEHKYPHFPWDVCSCPQSIINNSIETTMPSVPNFRQIAKIPSSKFLSLSFLFISRDTIHYSNMLMLVVIVCVVRIVCHLRRLIPDSFGKKLICSHNKGNPSHEALSLDVNFYLFHLHASPLRSWQMRKWLSCQTRRQ